MNTITIVGNLAQDPQLRYTNTGTPVTTISVAVNKRVKDQSGNWTSALDRYWDCTIWEAPAVNAAASFKLGDRVIVHGKVNTRRWEHDGQPREQVVIDVDEIGHTTRFHQTSATKVTNPTAKPASTPTEDCPF